MIKIAVCDDEEVWRNHIKEKCEAFFQSGAGKDYLAQLAGIRLFASGEELISAEEDYDILFLDIELPGWNGIEIKERFIRQEKKTRIIFLTNYDEWMKDAFGEMVAGFFCKPLGEKDLEDVMAKILPNICGKTVEVYNGRDSVWIQVNKIKYIKADDNYSCAVTEEREYKWLRVRMKEWEKILPEYAFCRINKSYIVNLAFFRYEKSEIILDKNTTVKIRKKQKDRIMEHYRRYIGIEARGM